MKFLKFFYLFINLTPLKLAAKNNNTKIIEFLLEQPGIQIQNSCFENCTKLNKITIPSSVH